MMVAAVFNGDAEEVTFSEAAEKAGYKEKKKKKKIQEHQPQTRR